MALSVKVKRRLRRGILFLVFAAIVVSVVTAYVLMPRTFDLTSVEPQNVEEMFTETGVVTSQNTVEVYSVMSGKIKEMPVSEGQTVKKGDVICVLESTVSAASESGRLQAQVDAQAAVVNQLTQARDNAQANYDRLAPLASAGAVSQVELDNASQALAQAQSQLEGAQAQLRAAENAAKSGSFQTGQAASNSIITAPADGVIDKLNIKDTNVVNQAIPVAVITNGDERPEIEVYVSTEDIETVKEGDTVQLTFESRLGDKVFPGMVTAIESKAEMVQSALGTPEYKVKVTVTYEETFLKEGYAVDVGFT